MRIPVVYRHAAKCSLSVCLMTLLPLSGVADETQRGLKPTVPVKPQFLEPQFLNSPVAPLETMGQSDHVLPDMDAASEPALLSSPSVFIKRVELNGSTVLNRDAIVDVLAKYENRAVKLVELNTLSQSLSLIYYRLGYINSGVIIPDQSLQDGVLTLQAVEGSLSDLSLTGNEDLNRDYLLDRIELGVNEPLNVNALQVALRRIQRDPLIDKVKARLKPVATLGEAALEVEVVEADSKSLSLGIDNHRSPSVGAEAITFAYLDRNLSGRGDALGVRGLGTCTK